MPMPDLTAISAVSASLKATLDISKAMLDLRDWEKVQLKAVELVAQIISAQQSALSAQTAQSELVDRERELKNRIMELENWDSEKAKYQLSEIATGVFAYTTKPGMEEGSPPHKICANCYQQRRKSILQAFSRRVANGINTHLVCNSCSADLIVKFDRYVSKPSRPSGGGWRTM